MDEKLVKSLLANILQWMWDAKFHGVHGRRKVRAYVVKLWLKSPMRMDFPEQDRTEAFIYCYRVAEAAKGKGTV